MGKTQIALEYAYRYREEYQVILWAKADSQEVLTSELVSFATLLKVPGQQEQDQQYALAVVKHWLEVHSNWLLILDNIEELNLVHKYLSTTTRGHILLTTNSQVMRGIAQRLDIDKMEPEEGALLLLRRVGLLDADAPLDRASEQERIQATEIITTLGGHPSPSTRPERISRKTEPICIATLSCTPRDERICSKQEGVSWLIIPNQ